MGVQTDVIADLDEAQAIAESATPTTHWKGFTFNGFHHIQLCTLLSLLKTGRANDEFERYLKVVEPVATPTEEEGPLVIAVKPEEAAELAAVASIENPNFEALASSWGATGEFAGWSESDVKDLLRQLVDLAESASLQGKHLMIWHSL